MKKTRPVRSLSTLALTLAALGLATSSFAADALSPCKSACLEQHQATVETLLRARPAESGNNALAHRETVLKAIDALNNCVQACDLAPTPEPASAPAPQKKR